MSHIPSTSNKPDSNMTEVIASRSPPYGWIILTFLYITFGLITILASNSDDSLLSTVRYATSFFMMGITFVFALHLGILATNLYGVLAFAALSIGYIFEGCAGLVFDNSEGYFLGTTPNTFSFYLFSLITYFFWTVAAVLFGLMFRETWDDLEFKSWATKLSKICSVALILSMLAVFIASIWCMFFASADVGDNILDEASSKSEHRDAVALNFFRASIWTWTGVLFLFFLVTAFGLRPIMHAIQHEADIIVWGLSSVWAADGIAFFQIVSFAFLLFFILEGTGKAQVSSSSLNYVLLAFNYSVLVTFFFLHNVVFSLSHIVFDHDEEDDLEANEEKLADDTSECTSLDGRRTIPGPEGAEIVMSGISDVTSMGAATAKSEHEALPTAGPGGIKTFLRVVSMRKPEITRIRSANIRFEDSDSYSEYSTSSYGDESYDDEEDNTTIRSSRL